MTKKQLEELQKKGALTVDVIESDGYRTTTIKCKGDNFDYSSTEKVKIGSLDEKAKNVKKYAENKLDQFKDFIKNRL